MKQQPKQGKVAVNFRLEPAQLDSIQALVDSEKYGSVSHYLRAVVRADLERRAKK